MSAKIRCECTDTGCPVHPGSFNCTEPLCSIPGDPGHVVTLERIDLGGTVDMCEACASDAMESGVFAFVDEKDED